MNRVAVYSSGGFGLSEPFFQYFSNHPNISIDVVVSNNQDFFLEVAHEASPCPLLFFSKSSFENQPELIIAALTAHKIDFILLLGFLLPLPKVLIETFRGKILNCHKALLPNFGGKGFYGRFIH